MERDQHQDQGTVKTDKTPARGWTQRFTDRPIRYRRFTDIDAGGRPAILLKFELAPGQSDLPQPVYDILHEMKYLDNNPAKGHGSGKCPTTLTFNRSKKHGRVWRLPDNELGRTVADIIDAKLSDLAEQIDRERGRGR